MFIDLYLTGYLARVVLHVLPPCSLTIKPPGVSQCGRQEQSRRSYTKAARFTLQQQQQLSGAEAEHHLQHHTSKQQIGEGF